jgi:hypothetical protein
MATSGFQATVRRALALAVVSIGVFGGLAPGLAKPPKASSSPAATRLSAELGVTVANLPPAGPNTTAHYVFRDFAAELPIFVEVALRGPDDAPLEVPANGAWLGWVNLEVSYQDGPWQTAALEVVPRSGVIDSAARRAPLASERTIHPGSVAMLLARLELGGKEGPLPGKYAFRAAPSNRVPRAVDLAVSPNFEIEVLADQQRTELAALEQATESYLRLGIAMQGRNGQEAERFLRAALASFTAWQALVPEQTTPLPGTMWYTGFRLHTALGDGASAHGYGISLIRCREELCALNEALFGPNDGHISPNMADDITLKLARRVDPRGR